MHGLSNFAIIDVKKVDCKTVVFGRFRMARSAVSVILECEAREPHTPASLPNLPRRFYIRSRPFVRIWTHRRLPSLVFAKNTTVLQSIKKAFLVTFSFALKLTIRSASETISAREFLRLRKPRVLHSGLKHRRPKLSLWGVLIIFFIFMWTFRDIVTAVVYCYITTEFHYAKRDSGL